MWSQKLQKITSFFLIFALLFSITLRVPFEYFFYISGYADEKEFYNIVSVIVDEESYDEIKSELIRYSRDVQGVLENTRVVILPTPSDAIVLDIASLNESLFFEWYKWVKEDIDFESRLIGSVFVWNIPLPTVFDAGNSSSSILPYIDFEDKAYIYNHVSLKYEKNENADTKLVPEIWHGVISPNTGTPAGNIQALRDYFDKNHDFYTGNGVFDQDLGVIDGRDTSPGETYEPYVFYYDQFRENAALQYEKYVWYQAYLENIEDITYNRYSKELAERIKDDVLWVQNKTIADLLINVDPDFDISGLSTGPDANASSDILTRYITDNTSKKFLEIFNGSTLSEMRKQVYNAGRYNDGWSRVNVDMPPFLISVLDQVSGEVIKNVNTSLEKEITDLVVNGLSRKITIPTYISEIQWGNQWISEDDMDCRDTYSSYYYGQYADDIVTASQCSIYRGSPTNSWTLTESNRWYNINNVWPDTAFCGQWMQYDSTNLRVSAGLSGFWGNNSPVNLNGNEGNYTDFELWPKDLKGGIRPVFDILGSKQITDPSKVPSPVNCFEEGVMIQTYDTFKHQFSQWAEWDSGEVCRLRYDLPLRSWDEIKYYVNYASGLSVEWIEDSPAGTTSVSRFCAADNVFTAPAQTLPDILTNGLTLEACTEKIALLWWVVVASTVDPDIWKIIGGAEWYEACPETVRKIYSYKSIPSHILHISPTDREFWAQTRSLFTPSLPIDTDRYIDFIWANGEGADYGYQRIDFPQLFRVSLDPWTPVTFENIAAKTKEHLDSISAQINTVRVNSDPSALSEKEQEIYEILSTGVFPDTDIDLYNVLQSKPLEIFESDGQSKEISYFDTLVFSVLWNNLDTVSAKYKFVFEEYLSNEFTWNEYNFHLPKSKKSYEIWYFAAPWDAQNMYIKLDPELKGTHPYADILSANLALQTTLLWANTADPWITEWVFECAPPDGVNIFQWIPAVICWLQNMLPPTVKIWPGACWGEEFLSEEELAEIEACQADENENGIVDCIEEKLVWWSISLTANAGRYFYNSPGTLRAEVYTNEWILARFDSNSYVDTVLTRVEIPADPTSPFSSTNTRVIYDRDIPSLATPEAYESTRAYVSFTDSKQRVNSWENISYFYVKWQDVNMFFQSSLQHSTLDWEVVVDLQSPERKIEVRADRVFVSSYRVEGSDEYYAENSAVASNLSNICVVDGSKNTTGGHVEQAQNISNAEEKLLMLIENYSLSGNALSLNYPLDIELEYSGETVYSDTGITQSTLNQVFPIFAAQKSWRYDLKVTDGLWFVSQRSFDIRPDSATSINAILATNLVETGWNISTHLFTILDQYDNPASWEIYSVDISISGGGLEFVESGDTEISYNVIDGYKAFRLRSTDTQADNTLNFVVKNINGDTIDSVSEQITTIRDIDMQFSPTGGDAVVWWDEVQYRVSFTDNSWNILDELNSRVYFSINKLYGTVGAPYVEVKNGIWEVSFTPLTLAAQDISIELQLEWGNEIYTEQIDILPEIPIKINLALSKDKMEASPNDSSVLEATLKDRYNNDVFTDSSTNLSFTIADTSAWIISVDAANKVVRNWKTQFRISGTQTPGVGYFKVTSSPDLSENSFDLIWQAPFDTSALTIPTMTNGSGGLTSTGEKFFQVFSDTKFITKFVTKTRLEASEYYTSLPASLRTQLSDFWDTTNSLRVNGIGENAGNIETFFFWDKEDIDGNAYNTLYSVLLWAPYWDISQENYLGWAMIFDPDNNALAVTSLLQSPYEFYDVFSFHGNGKAETQRSSDITQDIEMLVGTDSSGRLILDIHNNALEDYIWRAYYNLDNAEDIIFNLMDESFSVEKFSGDNARVTDTNGKTVFEILETWRFIRYGWSSFSFDEGYEWEWLSILLSYWDESIGQIILNTDNLATNVTRDSLVLENKLNLLEGTIILHIQSNSYSTRVKKLSQGREILQVYYQDPFATKYSLDSFHDNDILGIESSYSEEGIWWQDSNTMLLSFSAGESVWEASKVFQSFSLINLWDPVVSLKPVPVTFPNSSKVKSFDATVWKIIESDDDLIWYQIFDYNADLKKDLLTIHRDGYLKLYEHRDLEWDFVYHRSYWYAADGWSARTVKTWDFSWDGYGDIFFVTQSWEAALFNNVEKDISRYDIESQFSLSGAIIQAEVYDMDSDGSDDIVTLDDAGEIHIFYGWGTSTDPLFTKKFIGDGYSIELSGDTLSHGGAIYYDWLVQVTDSRAEDILLHSEDYLAEYQASIDAVGSDGEYSPPIPDLIDTALVDSFLYVWLPYIPTDVDVWDIDQRAIMQEWFERQVSSIADSIPEENLDENIESVQEFIRGYDDYITYTWFNNSYSTFTYFLRSQYADTEGIEITKSFTDTSLPYLQTGDIIYFDISIKNTSDTLKNNIAYVDTLPQFFRFVSDEFEVLSEQWRKIPRKYGVWEYNIILDWFSLAPGEETIVRYELEALPLSYGHIQVGLYEGWEVGDDIYGDIIVKEDNTNCWQEADIYRSVAVRSYEKWLTEPICNESDIDIWNTFPELRDDNSNGIPDYLETLLTEDVDGNIVPTDDTLALQEYAARTLADLTTDSDNDGIPDSDDSAPNTDSATDFMGALDNINGVIDDIAGDIDTLIEWLSCWFGGGSCFANPLNWAPLAPWNDPTLFGMPIWDGLHVNEGNPIFSALTGRQASCGPSPCCLPSVYPATSQAFIPWPFCGPPSAWWRLGTWSSTNYVRLFVTPTLTWGVGIAACFGWPALATWNANPIGVHPIVPGWNCIVAALPLFGCEWVEWDPGVEWYPYPGNDFSVIHANCDGTREQELASPRELETDFVLDYLNYLKSWVQPAGMYDRYQEVFGNVTNHDSWNYYLPTEPLISIGWWGEGSMSASVSLDTSALASGNFGDAIQVTNTRIAGFPWFMMDWVERQIDEIASKLTNLPKIFVILPDFGGIFDFSWEDFPERTKEVFQKWKEESAEKRTSSESKIVWLKAQKTGLDCNGKDILRCKSIDLQLSTSWVQKYANGAKETMSWIKEVYEFLGNIPLVNVETETININVPWIDPTELERFIVDWEYSLESYKQELQNATNSWSIWATCTGTAAEIARCQQQNAAGEQLAQEVWKFISSLETNIGILQEYKEFPERLADLINIKEVWLEQILCNIEAISALMWEWIATNGERFKAWVELYILIKAVLKSWQLFIDVFTGYEEQCHECKNERQDLQNFLFQLISAVIPSPPVIEFPKWPDIILDLHNVRAGINVYLPDFQVNLRPIVLPTLPALNLPRIPKVGVSLPELPLLPRFEIPELPELPSLPTVELPDLPPPPKIPKLFGAVEAVLNIMKLVTKVMCILKNSPFVPEWRAWDQIAFLTERNGYLPTDFINIRPPAFSYSMVSAIKVTTYVNFEFEMEFILEAVKAITAPLDDATNNIVNMFDIAISDLDFSDIVPENIDIDLDSSGESSISVDGDDISFAPLSKDPKWIYFIAALIATKFDELLWYTARHAGETVSNTEFITHVSGQLASESITSDPATAELQSLWAHVQNLTYSKEDTFIAELQKNNSEKYRTLGEIFSTEIEYSKKQQHDLRTLWAPSIIKNVDADIDTRGQIYTDLMKEYNIKTLDAAINLVAWPSEESQAFRNDIEKEGRNLMTRVRWGLESYKQNTLLAAQAPTSSSTWWSCHSSGAYEYVYEWIYVKEDGRNYKLFDYTDSLSWDEIPTISDIDNDGDDDVLYLVRNTLYFKENRTNTPSMAHVPSPLTLRSSDNKFYNGDTYYEAINGFDEVSVSDGAINIEFSKPTNPTLKNFRLVYNTLVDRYIDDGNNLPRSAETHIVDAIADREERIPIVQTSDYQIRNNLAVLSYAGAMNNLTLTTEKLINIKDDLLENKKVTITSDTALYAGDSRFIIEYSYGGSTETEIVSVPAYSMIQFERPANIVSVSGDAFVSLWIFVDIEDADILDYIGMPLLPGAHFEYSWDAAILGPSAHIDIRYYDGSEVAMDIRDIQSYRLYDLGNSYGEEYRIRLEIPNDFYYARIAALEDDTYSTWSRQILLAPQSYSDTLAPQIGLNQKIRIPVYQQQTVDFTPYVYEDGGLSWISDVRIDFDTSVDSDGDGDTKNDRDTDNITIYKTPIRLEVDFGAYDYLFEQNILIALTDDNGNVGEKEIPFEVYAPEPNINDVIETQIYGRIDEDLQDEPIRIYRYRWGVVEKLQKVDGNDISLTSDTGAYNFNASETASWLTLSYSWRTLASIDEYSGRIDIDDVFTTTKVIPSNSSLNTSAYPEVQILLAWNPIFRQFMKMPLWNISVVPNLEVREATGIYLQVLDQSRYNTFTIPLSVAYNAWSVSVYQNTDVDKTPVLTVFRDGRMNIDESIYRVDYRTLGEDASFVLVEKSTGAEVVALVYHMEANYILR